MPYSLVIEKKLVILNSDTAKMLELLDAVLKQEGLNEGSGLLPGTNRDQPGWWSRFIAKPIEKMTQKAFSAQSRELPLLTLTLDPPAKILREAYIDFLNELIQQEKLNSLHTEKNTIESVFILMRELLIRLASVALSTDMHAERDGDKILKVLTNFVTQINATELLKNKSLIGKNKLSDFNKHFATTHHAWVQCLYDMVDILKNLHANVIAISQVLDYLNEVKLTIIRQLIANLDPSQPEDNLAENWLRFTLYHCERKILGNKEELINLENFSSNYISSWDSINITQEQTTILEQVKNGLKSRTLKFYQQLNATNLLARIMHHIDQLFTVSGWMPIMLGAIKVDQLAIEIEKHAENCDKLLSLKPTDELLDNKPISNGLTKYNATTAVSLRNLAVRASKGLASLKNPRLHQALISCISHSLEELAKLQVKLNCQIVDPDYHKNFLSLHNLSFHEKAETTNISKPPLSPIKAASKSRFFSDAKTIGNQTDFGESLLRMFNLVVNEATELEEQGKYQEAAEKLAVIIEFGNKFLHMYKKTLYWRAELWLETANYDTAMKAYGDASKLKIFAVNQADTLLNKLKQLEVPFDINLERTDKNLS